MSGRIRTIPTALVDHYLRDKPDTLADYLYNEVRSLYELPAFDECNAEHRKTLAESCDRLAALALALGAQAREKPKKKEGEAT